MNLSVLWSIKRAAPLLLRHLGSYAELAEQDLNVVGRDLAQRTKAGVIFLVSAGFALLMLCAGIVALTWDTPNRVMAIAIMGGVFAVVAVFAGLYAARPATTEAFASVRREWQADRVVLDQMFPEPEGGANDEH